MSVEFGPRGNQTPTSRTESSDISPESLKIPRFYSRLAKRPLPPILAKMELQAKFQADRVADAHPVINPEETSRGKRIAGRRSIASLARALPQTQAIELEPTHYLESDNTDGSGQNEIKDIGKANVFIAAQDVLDIIKIIRLTDLDLDDADVDQDIIDCLSEDMSRGLSTERGTITPYILMEDRILSLSTPFAPKTIIEDDYSEESSP